MQCPLGPETADQSERTGLFEGRKALKRQAQKKSRRRLNRGAAAMVSITINKH